MKYVFVSDIHGNIEKLEECIAAFERENADKLVVLGDTAVSNYEDDNFFIAEILNGMKNKVEVIRGNCDTSDFEDKLNFEIFDDDILYVNGKFVSITHGHVYNFYHLPPNCGDIFIQGHTHVPMLVKQEGRILANPGSVSRPRGCDLRCYILITEDAIMLKTLGGSVIKKEKF
ncbi:MAG: YfcE family phosphodiesterase [Clostridia bacterium]|nr:YfcE family phosphodiesterase [Clostridia bacterium]